MTTKRRNNKNWQMGNEHKPINWANETMFFMHWALIIIVSVLSGYGVANHNIFMGMNIGYSIASSLAMTSIISVLLYIAFFTPDVIVDAWKEVRKKG